ncbi:hypothetical protein [Desulfogranum marinum]|jgi:hypothetical protein|uniref:hypothetical protein n=1 Tax=Desulfogranum marinum TaxID=453220 RepID=UPI001965F41A|nr:hypothetical protein [Desulfogranum marinum]MBM9512260.1 hypothetical protein [Desulfogranum marinum]
MEIKDFKQALELQKELSASLAANIEKLGKDKAPPVAETIKEQEQLLAQARAALKNSKKEKALAAKRWEQRIQKRETAVELLQKGLEDMKKRLKKIEKG